MYIPVPFDDTNVTLPAEIDDLIEVLARNTHEIWAEGRLKEGWVWGVERDDALKTHPNLIPYEQLDEIDKDYDRRTALSALRLIKHLGFDIRRRNGDS